MLRYLTALGIVFLAEMGDKTQLFLIGLSSRFKLRTIIISVAAAIAVLNGAAVAIGYFIGGRFDATVVKCAAGIAFLIFAYTSILPKKDEEEKKVGKGAFAAIFLSFLLAELGDKTQLMTLTLSAQERADGGGATGALLVFAACSVGLFAADLIGMMAGYFLSKKIPESLFSFISFAIFTFFGIYTIGEVASVYSGGSTLAVGIAVGAATLIFAALCGITLAIIKKRTEK